MQQNNHAELTLEFREQAIVDLGSQCHSPIMSEDLYQYFGNEDALDGPTMDRPNFAFVDADNIADGLERVLRASEVPENAFADFSIGRLLATGRHDRIYLYSGKDPSDTSRAWFEVLEQSSGFILRTGRLTQKGTRRKQEGVDVRLAIDAVRHAHASNVRSCCIYSGDGDFTPLVEALTDSGVFVTVASFNNPTKGDVAPRLAAAADEYVHLKGELLLNRSLTTTNQGILTHRYDVEPRSAYLTRSTVIRDLTGRKFKLSVWDGLRFFYAIDDVGFAVKLPNRRTAELWFQVVWPGLNATAVWQDHPEGTVSDRGLVWDDE